MTNPLAVGKPCPYAPFGVPCMRKFAHGSPHLIQIEAAYVEKAKAEARAALLADLRAKVEALPRQMQHADPFFPDTYDYETVGLDVLLTLLDQ